MAVGADHEVVGADGGDRAEDDADRITLVHHDLGRGAAFVEPTAQRGQLVGGQLAAFAGEADHLTGVERVVFTHHHRRGWHDVQDDQPAAHRLGQIGRGIADANRRAREINRNKDLFHGATP